MSAPAVTTSRISTKAIFNAPTIVLGLLCGMYFITYLDRVNIATAATAIKIDFGLNNTELGRVLGAFGLSYALFQIIGGWLGDKFGPRLTLFVCAIVWSLATVATGLVGGFVSLLAVRFVLGLGEGATFPTATRAMSNWFGPTQRGFAQGLTHSFARAGNALAPPIVVGIMVVMGWRPAFVILGGVSLIWAFIWVWYFRDDPRKHKNIVEADLADLPAYRSGTGPDAPATPWARLVPRMLPTTFVYFCYAWTLWLYLTWLPSLFQQGYGLDLKQTAFFSFGVLLAGVIGDAAGGALSDWLLRRTGNFLVARRNLIVASLLGSLMFLIPVLLFTDLVLIAICLSAAFFCLELTIGPIWSVPMDVAPKFSGTASGIMNTGAAVAGFASPMIFGWVVDVTGDWHVPFAGSIALLLLGAILAFWMHPDKQLTEALPPDAGLSKAVA
jgi:MFS family permease